MLEVLICLGAMIVLTRLCTDAITLAGIVLATITGALNRALAPLAKPLRWIIAASVVVFLFAAIIGG